MKRALIAATLLAVAIPAFAADGYVRGYTRKDGTYVAPHHRTTPDSSRGNNYGSEGNYNPYTGQPGHVNPYQPPAPRTPTYPTYPSYPTYPR